MPYGDWKPVDVTCYGCGKSGHVEMRVRESDDGGHSDEQYSCRQCGYTWWVDGIDS